MKNKLLLFIGIWIILIRLWMLFIIPTFLADSKIVYLAVKDDYHHWQFGSVLFILFFLIGKVFKLGSKKLLILYSFCLGLIFDQTFYILGSGGIDLGYNYLSKTDNVITFALGLIFLGASLYRFKPTGKE
ncbi:MAG: hypothetical protein Q7T50_04145 [Candidatus Magasanikbacteria bacterium]|nr:hypothetical protein [Candidatus Magasanikbacteria bacterium]